MKLKDIKETGLYLQGSDTTAIWECFEYSEEEPFAFSVYALNEILYKVSGQKEYNSVGEIAHFDEFDEFDENTEFTKLDDNKYEVQVSQYVREL